MTPVIIAHRGDSAHRPENTLAAFASAIEVGAELVEFDVQLTGDGHVLVLHDGSVDRTTNGHGLLREMTLSEARALSAGYSRRFGTRFAGEKIPALSEALGLLRPRARVMIEIKSESVTDDVDGGIEARTIAEVRRAEMESQVALISFNTTALLRCRQLAPDIVRGVIFARGEPEQMLTAAAAVGSNLLMPERGLLATRLCDLARKAGLKISTWVVDEPSDLEALAQYELYGIASNRPGLLIEALAEA